MESIQEGPGESLSDAAAASARFVALWDEYLGRVHRYVCRHVDPHTAHDVVSETVLVAWRRIDEVPDEALPWLLVVARNTISNTRRATSRRRAMESQLARVGHLAAASPAPGNVVPERDHILAALGRLSPQHREAVLLVAWDGLDAAGAAQVLGTSPAAFKMRLSRARRQLRRELDDETSADRARRTSPTATAVPAIAEGPATPRSAR